MARGGGYHHVVWQLLFTAAAFAPYGHGHHARVWCTDGIEAPMGLIAAVIDKRGTRYTEMYLRERIARYQFHAGPGLEVCVQRAGSERTHLLLVTTAQAKVRPVGQATPDGHFMSIGYFRSQRDPAITSARIAARIADGTFNPDVGELLQFEGEFAAVWYDAKKAAIHLVTDRFGARSMFIYDAEDATIVCSDIAFLRHLCGAPLDLDPLGIFQMFCLDHTIGETTNLQHVTKVLPASHVVLSGGRVDRRVYWHLEHQPRSNISNVEHSVQVFDAMCESARWRADLYPGAEKAVALSGGLDSRFVAASLEHPEQFMALTIGRPDSREVQVAHQVATRLGMRHASFVLEEERLSGFADRLWALTGGLLPLHHPATTLQLLDRLSGQYDGVVVFGGGPGDVLAGSYIPRVGMSNGSVEQVTTEYVTKRMSGLSELSWLFRRDVYAEVAPRCRESVLASMHGVRGADAAQRITAWAMTVRQPSFTFLGPGIHNNTLVDVSPHLGYRYSDLMLALPVGHLYQKNFYRFMLHRELPRLRDIVYANTGKPLTGVFDRPGALSEWAHRLERGLTELPLWQRASTFFGRIRRPPRSVAAYSLLRYLVEDAALLQTMRETLKGSADLAALLDVDAALHFIDQRVAEVKHDERSAARILGNLATLCYTVRVQAERSSATLTL